MPHEGGAGKPMLAGAIGPLFKLAPESTPLTKKQTRHTLPGDADDYFIIHLHRHQPETLPSAILCKPGVMPVAYRSDGKTETDRVVDRIGDGVAQAVLGESNLMVFVASTSVYHPVELELALSRIDEDLSSNNDTYFARWKRNGKCQFASASDFANRFAHFIGFFFTNTVQNKFVPNKHASKAVLDDELNRVLSKLESLHIAQRSVLQHNLPQRQA